MPNQNLRTETIIFKTSEHDRDLYKRAAESLTRKLGMKVSMSDVIRVGTQIYCAQMLSVEVDGAA